MSKPQIGVYYFPNYHVDETNEQRHGKGWCEWEVLKYATPRFEGHHQPKIPLWGYEDESDPTVMEKKIQAAAGHGIDAFIFDWYWYNGAPYLHKCLENGFFNAQHKKDFKFSLMWANHDWKDLFPAPRHGNLHTFADGKVDEVGFKIATEYMIENYFNRSDYWRVDGGLYFSIYDLNNLITGLGGIENTNKALRQFRDSARNAGCGELHLNAILGDHAVLPFVNSLGNISKNLTDLGFDSITSYVWIHNYTLPQFPCSDYSQARKVMKGINQNLIQKYHLPYFPNVTMGWDSTTRTVQCNGFDQLDYPYLPVFTGNTPAEFELALKETKQICEAQNQTPNIITINSWNEWTEGSYLEPDTENGMAYLEAIQKVFGA